MTARPKRQNLGDRLLSPDAGKSRVACDHAVAPFDRAATEMERKWGYDRLPELVAPDMAGKYGAAVGALNEAIAAQDQAQVAWHAGNCIKGLAAMNAQAEAAGHRPQKPEIWEVEIDGALYGLIRDGKDWALAEAARPDLRILTLREAVVTYSAYSALSFVQRAKDAFPGAEIVAVKPRSIASQDELNDPIPF